MRRWRVMLAGFDRATAVTRGDKLPQTVRAERDERLADWLPCVRQAPRHRQAMGGGQPALAPFTNLLALILINFSKNEMQYVARL